MKNNNIIIIHPQSEEQIKIIEAFMKALHIKFKITKSSYDDEFVAKIEKSKEEFKQGDYKKVDKKDLKDFLGLS